MGRLMRVHCEGCDAVWQLRTGYGLLHGRLENIVKAFPDTVRSMLPLDAMRTYQESWSFAYEPAHCPACHIMGSVPVLRFPEAGKVYGAPCPACDGAVELIPESGINRFACPVCGKEALESEDIGMWD